MEAKTTYKCSTKQKSWFFEKVNKIENLLVNLTKMRREKTQVCKIRIENGEITAYTKDHHQGLF
jgi:hypothetical protein